MGPENTDIEAEIHTLLGTAERDDMRRRLLDRLSPEYIVSTLSTYLSEERIRRIERVLASRTRTVVTVVDGLSNTGNVSAILRTSDALGFQEVHVIARSQKYKHSRRTTQGAHKWLDVHIWTSPEGCLRHLKERGFRIVATASGPGSVPVQTLDFTRQTALIFGNERDGVSADTLALADEACRIEIRGFVESFNVSVAAALCLYHARTDREQRLARPGDLGEAEAARLRALFYMQAVTRSGRILEERRRRDVVGRASG